jgi:class 3 adenylate cyclase
MRPKTGYARNGDVRIAYQVVGDGPVDLVFTPPYISHVDLWWMLPETARFLERLASFSRLILYDKRGTGLSDPAPALPAVEDRMEDLHAVLDAVGADRPAVMGMSEGGPISMLFAATYPERTRSLTLFGTFCRVPASDYFADLVPEVEAMMSWMSSVNEHWGSGEMMDLFAPEYAGNEALRQSMGLFERLATSPAMAQALLEANLLIDVSHCLSAISAPTLVLHRREEMIPLELARDVAARVPAARLVELPGSSHLPWLGDSSTVLDHIEQFVTGARPTGAPERALVTVLFTDIVGSTDLAAQLGDQAWRSLLERHDALVSREVAAAGGVVVKSLGDGAFVRFDGPARAIRAARAVVEAAPPELGVRIRAGVHTGECEILGDDLGGVAVHLGARIAAKAAAGEVLVSAAVRDLVLGSPIGFEDRGVHDLKGVPGSWQLLAVTDSGSGVRPAAPAAAHSVAPNAPSSTFADRTVARMARVGSRSPRVGRQIGRALRAGVRVRRPPRR